MTTVRQGEQVLCTLQHGRERRLCRLAAFFPAFSMRGEDLLWFKGTSAGRFGLGTGRVDVPSGSPFAALGLSRAARTYHLQELSFVAHAPRLIGRPVEVPLEGRR